jgi:hypothetical protein
MTDEELKVLADEAVEKHFILVPKALTPEQMKKLSEWILLNWPEAKDAKWHYSPPPL